MFPNRNLPTRNHLDIGVQCRSHCLHDTLSPRWRFVLILMRQALHSCQALGWRQSSWVDFWNRLFVENNVIHTKVGDFSFWEPIFFEQKQMHVKHIDEVYFAFVCLFYNMGGKCCDEIVRWVILPMILPSAWNLTSAQLSFDSEQKSQWLSVEQHIATYQM